MTLAPITATGLPHSAESGAVGARGPVDEVLELARASSPLYSGVAISTASAAAIASRSRLDLGGRVVGVAVLVVGRERLETLVQLDLDARPGRARRPPAAAPCCATLPAGCRRSPGSASALRGLDGRDADQQLDLVGTSRLPFGSVWFHLRSNSRRSIAPSSSKPMRSLPHGSVPPSATRRSARSAW